MYSINDWRDYLAHEDKKSKYDWSTGTNPPDYNHDYYEEHKDEILAKRKGKDGGVRDFDGNGVGYKAKTDDGKSYENDDDWSDELTPEEIKNIKAHNEQVEQNIANLTKTVNDYIAANKGKLSNEQVAKLKKDLATQTEIAREQMISTKNSDDYKYVMNLRKQSNGSGKTSSTRRSPNGSTSSNKSSKSSGSSSKSTTKRSDSKMYTEGSKRRRTNVNSAASNSTNSRVYTEGAERRRTNSGR